MVPVVVLIKANYGVLWLLWWLCFVKKLSVNQSRIYRVNVNLSAPL